MNGQKPQIKESERVPIDLSINPLRRREAKSKISNSKVVPSKILSRSKTTDNCEEHSNTSTQADVNIRPSSGFRIREQHTARHVREEFPTTPEKPGTPVDKGPSKVEKYNKEKNFVKKIEKDNRKVIPPMNITYKSNLKKDGLTFKKSATTKKQVMLPPLEPKEE